jgi:hypothetical protein
MNNVPVVVLGLLAGDRPDALIQVEFRPHHCRDFISPLRRQQKELYQRAERPTHLIGRRPMISASERTRSRAFSLVGGRSPSHGFLSIKSFPTAQPKSVRRRANTRFA